MTNAITQISKDIGYDIGELLSHAKNDKPNDLENLAKIERAFMDCELMGKQLILHEGKLLARAQEIFYANHPKGRADQLYGKWQKERVGISRDSANKRIQYYKFISANKSVRDAVVTLPSMNAVFALASKKTPDAIRKKYTKLIKAGEDVTEKMVKDAIKATKPKADKTERDDDIVSTRVTVDINNPEWDKFTAHFTTDELQCLVDYLSTQGILAKRAA